MKTKKEAAAAAASVGVDRWRVERQALMSRIAPRFARRESFAHACDLVTGLMSELDRKNCWTIGEHAGHARPYGLQNLLSRASWDHDGVRDDVCSYVVEYLGDPDTILVVDETGDLKKAPPQSVCSASTSAPPVGWTTRRSRSTCYASPAGHALIDAELYLPRAWTTAPHRLATAGVPDEVEFATKPELATPMIIRVLDAGVPAG